MLHAWSESTFKSLGGCLGQVLEVDKDAILKRRVDVLRVKLLWNTQINNPGCGWGSDPWWLFLLKEWLRIGVRRKIIVQQGLCRRRKGRMLDSVSLNFDNSGIGDPLLCLNENHSEKSSGMHQMKENFRMEEILAWFLNKLAGILALRGISFHLQLRKEAFLTALLLKVYSKLCKKISGSLW